MKFQKTALLASVISLVIGWLQVIAVALYTSMALGNELAVAFFSFWAQHSESAIVHSSAVLSNQVSNQMWAWLISASTAAYFVMGLLLLCIGRSGLNASRRREFERRQQNGELYATPAIIKALARQQLSHTVRDSSTSRDNPRERRRAFAASTAMFEAKKAADRLSKPPGE